MIPECTQSANSVGAGITRKSRKQGRVTGRALTRSYGNMV
uniref:Uncharacterized protein n=1 Tax=Arundo donax TaxID=35708 RepID=A0A0A9A169_ARUDO